ncbi:MAG: hypothetical protein QOJ99_5923 [Bryobacterales bacterium]|nr:hypothetical protein [Bryobacterales bacterium]
MREKDEFRSPSELQEAVGVNTRLLQNCSKCAFGHSAGMTGNRRVSVGRRIKPDFVAASRLATKFKPVHPKVCEQSPCIENPRGGPFNVACDLQRFRQASPLRNQAGQFIRTCRKNSLRQFLYLDANGQFHASSS